MRLNAPPGYDRAVWQQLLNALTEKLGKAYIEGQDIELQPGQRLILRSANGTRFSVTVGNTGTLITTSL